MQVEIRNHPAQARHPITDAPLFEADGTPVPLLPNDRAVYLDGALVGYTSLDGPVTLTVALPQAAVDAIAAKVAEDLGPGERRVSMPLDAEALDRALAADRARAKRAKRGE